MAERGHEVAIAEMKDVIAADVTPENRRYMFANFEEHHVLLRPSAKVGRFYSDGVDYTLADGAVGSLRGYDSVVLAMGSRSNAALKEAVERIAPQVFRHRRGGQGPGQRGPGHRGRAGGGAENLTFGQILQTRRGKSLPGLCFYAARGGHRYWQSE